MAFRKYPPITRPTRKIQMLASQGTVLPGSVIPRRRLGLYRPTVKVQQLGSLGVSSGGAASKLLLRLQADGLFVEWGGAA